MFLIINSFILSILFLQYNSNIIVLPFRDNRNGNIDYNNLSNIFDSKQLYTEVLIGEPPQCLNINIDTEAFAYYILPNSCYDSSPSFYNYTLSKSFKIVSIGYEDDIWENIDDAAYVSDFFSFYNSTDLQTNISINNFEFYYASFLTDKKYKIVCGNAGFGLKQRYDDYNIDTFLNSIKAQELIDDYFWTYEYFEKEENKILNFPKINNKYIIDNFDGIIILGNYIKYNPYDYDKNSYMTTLAVERDHYLKWCLAFDKIYCKSKEDISIIKLIHADLSINFDYIISPKEYFENLILPFFNSYLEKQICKKNEIQTKSYIYEVINCDKTLFTIQDIKNFPTIYFYHHNFNYTFELTYNELFKEINNNIYFLILNNIGKINENIWKLGKIFLKKYHFSFNQDSKMIIFYNEIKPKNEEENKEEKNKEKNEEKNEKNINKFNINYIWIIACIISLIVGLYIGATIINKNRKKRANELKEDYDYESENVINDDKENNLINEKNIEANAKGLGVN